MGLVHRNIISHTIIVPILAALVYILTSVTASGGVEKKGDKYQEQYHKKRSMKMAELSQNWNLA